jgi:shikimate dehydrogenase
LLGALPGHAFVFDLVYVPPETALVRAARARGLCASGGLPMLLYQGAAAFTLWTGREAPLDLMRDALGG